ncbi:hypothetical protein Pla108_11040 [Botrimarina colliarenosi]|uniref:Uncharacterized protein n=1 Tax=Botrimarina colliarenosi TaxID=2528001 RepID=A0A5C6ALM2_9BACT|nr:hypothetical protein [Botrimarina colliarenosi]TWU00159.1 hypothetical protein Pla108_11040 [Botrimarina colliarenosi]
MKSLRLLTALLLLWSALLNTVPTASACPFCAAEQRTLTEEINDSSVVLLGRLSAPSEAARKLADADVPYGFIDPETGAAKFTIETVLTGKPLVDGVTEIEAIYFGEADTETLFFLRGVGEPPDWAIPLPLSPLAAEYVPKLLELPASGADRLAFFQDYLEHEDLLLAQDAYDEFARAPYQDLIDLGPRMDRDQLRAWITDVSVSPSRRRLFLTMLGVCGEPADVTMLERMLMSDARVIGPAVDAGAAAAIAVGGSPVFGMTGELVRFGERQRKLGLDALVACYMTLAGKHGDPSKALDLIDQRFLKDPDADYSHVYAALQALRFLASEQADLAPHDRLLQSARLLLDNPEFADQVIPDLARWEDWSVLERLADMYRSTFDENDATAPVKYVREPIITYLDVAKEQPGDVAERAEQALAAIEPLDPAAVERARTLREFGFLAQARAKAAPAVSTPGDSVTEPATEPAAEPAADIAVDPPADVAADLASPMIDEASEAPAAESAVESTVDTPAASDPVAADPNEKAPVTVEAAPTPPSRVVLLGVPVVAAALLVGFFWLILRSGVA